MAACASLSCSLIVFIGAYYEDPIADAPDYLMTAQGLLTSVGCLAVPVFILKAIFDLF
jgi:hypothetical protein